MRNIAIGRPGAAGCHSTRIWTHQVYAAYLADSIRPGAWAFHLTHFLFYFTDVLSIYN